MQENLSRGRGEGEISRDKVRRIIDFGRIGDALLIRPNNRDACYYAPRPIICRENSIKLRQLCYCAPRLLRPLFYLCHHPGNFSGKVSWIETIFHRISTNYTATSYGKNSIPLLVSLLLIRSRFFISFPFSLFSFFFFTFVSNIFKIFFTACFVIMESKTCDARLGIFFSYYPLSYRFHRSLLRGNISCFVGDYIFYITREDR